MPASIRSHSLAEETDTPNKRRKVEPAEECVDALRAVSGIGERSKNLWFDDGNVIISAEGRAFKVHASVLMLRSEVLKELLNGPALARLPERLEGCPVLRVEDKGRDFEYLFTIIYNGGNRRALISSFEYSYNNAGCSSWLNSQRPPIAYVEFRAVVTVAVKYKVKEIIDEAIYRLSRVFSTRSIDDWNPYLKPDGDKTPIALDENDCIDVLRVARLLNMRSILPLVFYACCNIEDRQITAGVFYYEDNSDLARFNEDDLHTYLKGRCTLIKESMKVKRALQELAISIRAALCPSKSRCRYALQKLCLAALDADFYHKPSAIDSVDRWLDVTEEKRNAKLCQHCDGVLRNLINERREEAWRKLGKIFGIEEWPAGQSQEGEDNYATAAAS
ncbi:uncharacterized protein PHACADRAFT_193696 [Phanerochaete carnosa HHB-10118-sp]|uniref:BTB domain-containing protein n=1 Tax=Phanerochaete carnosa (strain HHB-10118-sp) TaxID=650164 RepID=K5WHH4_PHACS|nr:uncharacterized protein PHACADRAFT_193696 [Phanerochaete carnosa HHB-10118-sp]EKM58564.1 hypothetical protein PHACADRAFT_193696 [Phanerochaete carnosa HHB-10118-sp]